MFTVGICMFKVNNRNTRARCKICSKLTIKTPERRHWRNSAVFIVNFEHISHLLLVFILLNLSRWMPAGCFSLIKETNRLLSTGMSNIYLKVTIEKKWPTQNFDFLSLKSSSSGQLLGSSNWRRYITEFSNLLLQLKIKRSVSKSVWAFLLLLFERNYDVSKSKSPCFLLKKCKV